MVDQASNEQPAPAAAGRAALACAVSGVVEGSHYSEGILVGGMGIDHGRAQVGMAEQTLDGTDRSKRWERKRRKSSKASWRGGLDPRKS